MNRLIIVPDTNVIISGLIFGGNSEIVLRQLLSQEFIGITSPPLQTELSEVLRKKFPSSQAQTSLFLAKLKQVLIVVNPREDLHILNDIADNRVLEAALASRSSHIITGDKQLLALGSFLSIQILNPAAFLKR